MYFYKAHPIYRRAKYFQGKKLHGLPLKDVTFLKPDGNEVDENTWKSPTNFVAYILEGSAIDEINEMGERIADDTFLIILNGSPNNVKFKFPHGKWSIVVSSYLRDLRDDEKTVEGSKELEIEGRTAMVYRRIEY